MEFKKLKKTIRIVCGYAALASLAALSGSLFAKGVADAPATSDTASEIINGTAGSTNTYPWMGYIAVAGEPSGQFCGASLISSTWALTAAHCFNNEEDTAPDLVTGALASLHFGSDSTTPTEADVQISGIARIIIHPSYQPDFDTSPNSDDFDMALVELSSAITLTPVQLLAKGNAVPAGTEALIMGWGTTELDAAGESVNASDSLLEARQIVIDQATCAAIYISGITDNMLCAGAPPAINSDTCQGDSGGPLSVAVGSGFVQIGVVSFGGTETGPKCADPNAPGVYASVAALADFIQEFVPDAVFTTLAGSASSSTALGAPSLTVSASGPLVNINWTEVSGAKGYILYYAPLFGTVGPSGSVDMGPTTSLQVEIPSGLSLYVAIQPYDEQVLGKSFSNIEVIIIE
jgi:secreted trypsin-like serine protease